MPRNDPREAWNDHWSEAAQAVKLGLEALLTKTSAADLRRTARMISMAIDTVIAEAKLGQTRH